MNQLVMATGNQGKIQEAREILGVPVEMAEMEIDEVQSLDLEYVSKRKTEYAYNKVKRAVITDDVGVYIDSLNGFPGPLAKYFIDALDYEGILKLLRNQDNRKVTVRTAVGYHDGSSVHTFIGEARGTITKELRGKNGWGFDPIIVPDGYDQTFAEMGPEGKNKISHRRKALDKLRDFLNTKKDI